MNEPATGYNSLAEDVTPDTWVGVGMCTRCEFLPSLLASS